MSQNTLEIEREEKKELYAYQKGDIDAIFDRLDNAPPQHHLLYQLPTGGGKTVIFSEIVRRYLANNDKNRPKLVVFCWIYNHYIFMKKILKPIWNVYSLYFYE